MRQRHVAPPGRRNRPIPIAGRLGEHPRNLRDTAVDYLRQKVAAGEAGLDRFDRALFVVQAGEHETVWAFRMLSAVALIIDASERDDQGRRYKAVLEADAHMALKMDAPDAPIFESEPERPLLHVVDDPVPVGFDERYRELYGKEPPPRRAAPEAVMDAVFGVLPGAPESARAVRDAKDAYERKYGEKGPVA